MKFISLSRVVFAALLSLSYVVFLTGCQQRPQPVTQSAPDSAQHADSLRQVAKTVTLTIELTNRADTTAGATPDTTIRSNDNVKTFSPRDTIRGRIKTENATDGMTLTGRWFYSGTGQGGRVIKIAENTARLQPGTNISNFEMLNNKPWVQGSYKLILYIDSIARDSAQFTVAPQKR